MFRRPIFILGRPLLRRPRLLGTAAVVGLGYAIGRSSARGGQATRPRPSSRPPAGSPVADTTDPVARLRELSELYAAGHLTDEEFAAAKRSVLGL